MNLQEHWTVDEIESLLAGTVPQADKAFERQLGERLLAKLELAMDNKSVIGLFFQSHHKRVWALGVAVLIVLILAFLSIAPVRIAAQELLNYFSQAVNDIVPIELTVIESGDFKPADLAEISVNSIEEASARAGFEVKAPTYLPDGFSLETIMAVDGISGASLIYKRGDIPGLMIIHQYDANKEEMVIACGVVSSKVVAEIDDSGNLLQASEPETVARAESDSCAGLGDIGASAEILTVQIGEVTGEYVAGGWVPAANVDLLDEAEPGETVTFENVWDLSAPEHRLRWEVNGIAYDLSIQAKGLTMEEITFLAESMR